MILNLSFLSVGNIINSSLAYLHQIKKKISQLKGINKVGQCFEKERTILRDNLRVGTIKNSAFLKISIFP